MSIGNSIDLYYSAVHLSVIYPLIISRLIISRRLPKLHLNFGRMCPAPAEGRDTASRDVVLSNLRTNFKLHLDQKQLRDTFTLSHHNFVCTISIPIVTPAAEQLKVCILCARKYAIHFYIRQAGAGRPGRPDDGAATAVKVQT